MFLILCWINSPITNFRKKLILIYFPKQFSHENPLLEKQILKPAKHLWWGVFAKMVTAFCRCLFFAKSFRVDLFSTYAKFSEKLICLYSCYAHVCVRIMGKEMLVFRRICVLIKWINSHHNVWYGIKYASYVNLQNQSDTLDAW